jgi:DNA invertase Pin-like site-specific DNA recombinase
MTKKQAVAYYRTSSATNVGADKDSERRQREAVTHYAASAKIEVVQEFYDAAVSGADPIQGRPGFVELLEYCQEHDVANVIVETANRFARDLVVQETGYTYLRDRGLTLIPADAPDHFTTDDPMKTAIRQILGVIAQLDKAMTVAKLRGARDRVRAERGRCEGRKPVPEETVAMARKLARRSPRTGKRRSLRDIAAQLARAGRTSGDGKPYRPGSVALMIR